MDPSCEIQDGNRRLSESVKVNEPGTKGKIKRNGDEIEVFECHQGE
ncbi:8546_t:CDS:2 [Dentiscutata erythropus]|uniref:8546_t:CDS:1 n=1 Tax=Dentiscutata erythropus TaxID=1348616 RepID=A0A9N9BNX8_9GLOM|nr:8546_t:CDS:2 [Dentiscutata erythropus]